MSTRAIPVLRGLRTRERKFFAAQKAEVDAQMAAPADQRDKSALTVKLTILKQRYAKLEELDSEIINHQEFPAADLDSEIESSHSETIAAGELVATLQLLLACDATAAAAATLPPVTANIGQQMPLIMSGPLQVLDTSPEPFNGDRRQYRMFIAQFTQWVSRRSSATSTDRLTALRKLLRGDARVLVDSLAFCDSSYEVALKLLEDNFGGVDIERQQILSELMHLPKVKSAGDSAGLRRLLNSVQANIRTLEGLQCPINHYALSFGSALRGALPSKLIFEFAEMRRLTSIAEAAACRQPKEEPAGNSSDSTGRPPTAAAPAASTSGGGYSENAAAAGSVVTPAVAAAEEIQQLIEYLSRYASHREQATALEQTESQHNDGHSSRREQQHPPPPKRNVNPGRYHQTAAAAATAAAAGIDGSTAAAVRAATANQHPRRKVWPCLFCSSSDHSSSRCSAKLSLDARKKILANQQKCELCFRRRHTEASQCDGPQTSCKICHTRDHYTSMHPPGGQAQSAAAVTAAGFTELGGEVNGEASGPTRGDTTMLFTASAFVVYCGQKIPVRVFLDQGSTITFVKPDLMKRLPALAPLHRADIDLSSVSGCSQIQPARYSLTLQSTHSEQRVDVLAYEYAFSVDPTVRPPANIREVAEAFGKVHPLADRSLLGEMPADPPAILVGNDQFYRLAYVGKEVVVSDELVARETCFGWSLGGPLVTAKIRAEVSSIVTHCCSATMSKPAQDIQRLCSLEEIGVKNDPSSGLSADEESALKQFNENLQYNGKEYTVAMPHRPTISQLANNKSVALHRLEAKLRSLRRDSSLYHRYDSEVMAFVNAGHAEEVMNIPLDEEDTCDGSYHVPHHQVITKSDGKAKWRIVFDCSSSAPRTVSLNSHLLPGPNLNPDMVALLINFRLNEVALSADIVKAYLCIRIVDSDRQLFRFFWQGPSDSHVRCFQMTKVIWGATPSGFILAATLRHHLSLLDTHDHQRIGQSLYHDDMLRSFRSEAEASAFADQLTDWLATANMQLAKWKTSSPEVARHLCNKGVESDAFGETERSILKVLGILWSPRADEFRFALDEVIEQVSGFVKVTKRVVLRVVASIYDPLGWLVPFVLRGKLIIQKLWTKTLQWDQPVDPDLLSEFNGWTTEIKDLHRLKISRCCSVPNREADTVQLHIFGDASEKAFAAAAYLQTTNADGNSQCSLIMAKSRLAPRDKISLPRLELLAALLATRLRRFITEVIACEIHRVYFYTDSMVTYFWCTSENPGRWKPFVANRVTEIQANSSPQEWHFVPGEQNIADFATRGVTANDLSTNAAWWCSPEWLALPPEQQPVSQPQYDTAGVDLPPVDTELRAVSAAVQHSTPWLDLTRYSTLDRAVRVVATALRYLLLLQKKPLPPRAELLQSAERRIIRWTQQQYFKAEINATLSGERVTRNSKLAAFELFIDDEGLLRAKTRLTLGPQFSKEEKNPLIIPGESRFAALLILQQHRVNAHFGTSTILAALRRRFWVTRGRQIIKRLLRDCVICKKRHGSPADQVQAPLPPERVTLTAPFAVTGLDFCGPFYTRHKKDTRKNYIALFTCAATRAIHLELVPSMVTAQTHLAVRRFLSLYSGCRKLITDNARSFVKAATDIKRLFNSFKDPDLQGLLADRRIVWDFICPRSPWHGGFWERLVGSVKTALAKTLGRSLIGFEEFRTVISELTAVINDRPLTYVDADPHSPGPLTPAHFIRGGAPPAALCSAAPLDSLGPHGTAGNDLRLAHQAKVRYSAALSIRWYREYVLQLRSANLARAGNPRPIQIGDVCLLKDDNIPRLKWTLVRIEAAHPGRDGAVRTYSVRFSNSSISRRAAQLLYPLEVV